MPIVSHLEALEILDNRGVPTLEVSCVLEGGIRGNATAPAAGTPGPHEVIDLRDGDQARHGGLGCRKAVALVEGEVRTALVGKRFGDQAALDKALRQLDGTSTRSKLGGNTSFAVSLAFARAHAAKRGQPLFRHFAELVGGTLARLPTPIIALFSATPAEGTTRGPLALSFIPPEGATLDETFATAAQIRRTALTLSREAFDGRVGVAADGGVEVPAYDTASLLAHATRVVRQAGAADLGLGWVLRGEGARRFDGGYYRVDREKLTPREVGERLAGFVARDRVKVIIDPFGADDWEPWRALGQRLPDTLIAADDLLATNLVRVEKAVAEKAARAIVLKPGQTGSLTDAARTARYARKAGLALIVSGRTGETEDDWIADLAVGWGADYLQAGATSGSERLAKYNRLLAIEKKTKWKAIPTPPAGHRTVS